jgi:flavin reductase (DIM6/NTAB) family NADH-FMN oxidoreductase RutF
MERRFREAMGQVAAPVSVVSIMHEGRPHGTTVSAFASLSMDPPMLLVSLDNTSQLLSRVTTGVRLGINILSSGQHQIATRFAKKGNDKFDAVDWSEEDGAPRISGCHAWAAVTVEQLVPAGDHTVVLGGVVGAAAAPGLSPLTYHRRIFGTHMEI